MADPKVRLAAVVNDEEAFGHVFAPVFEEKMMDHFDTTAEIGRQYFGPRAGLPRLTQPQRPQCRLADDPPTGRRDATSPDLFRGLNPIAARPVWIVDIP